MLSHYVVPSFVSIPVFTLNSIFVLYEYFYSSFPLIFICVEYFFPSHYFQSICIPRSDVCLIDSIYMGLLSVSIQLVYVFWSDHLIHLHLRYLSICYYCHNFQIIHKRVYFM